MVEKLDHGDILNMYECRSGSIRVHVIAKDEEDAKKVIHDLYKWNLDEIVCKPYNVKIRVIVNAPSNI